MLYIIFLIPLILLSHQYLIVVCLDLSFLCDDDDDDDDDDDTDVYDPFTFSDHEITAAHRTGGGRVTGDVDSSGGSATTHMSYLPQFSMHATMYLGIIDFLQVRGCPCRRVRAALHACARACRSGTSAKSRSGRGR